MANILIGFVAFAALLAGHNCAKLETSEYITIPDPVYGNVPSIPFSLQIDPKVDPSAAPFVDLWQFWYVQEEAQASPSRPQTPEVIFVVDEQKLGKVVPSKKIPLYAPSDSTPAHQYLMDSMVAERIDFYDVRMLRPEGLTVSSMTGKSINIKRNLSYGIILINDIRVIDYQEVSDGTVVVIMSDFLFDHEYLMTEVSPLTSGPSIPPISPAIRAEGPREFASLWQHVLRQNPQMRGAESVRTIVVTSEERLSSIIPGGSRSLYSSRASSVVSYLMDCMSEQSVDYRQISPRGIVRAATISGKTMEISKDFRGIMMINGIVVKNSYQLSDGTIVYEIDQFIFQEMKTILEIIGQPTLRPTVPPMPSAIIADNQYRVHPMMMIWGNLTSPSQNYERTPKMVLVVEDYKMNELLSQGSADIFYSIPYSYMAAGYINDSISYEYVASDNRRMQRAEGLQVKSVSGKPLVFKIDSVSRYPTVNGVQINRFQRMADGTMMIVLNDFLFTHYEDLSQALISPCQQFPQISIPGIPKVLHIEAPSSFSDVWIFWSSVATATSYPPQNAVRTVIAVETEEMQRIIKEKNNPLFDCEAYEIIERFINDSVSTESIDINNRRLRSRSVRIQTMTGRYLEFQSDNYGRKTVNGVEIVQQRRLSDGTVVLVVKNFLFQYASQIKSIIQNKFGSGTVSPVPIPSIPMIPASLETNKYQYDVATMMDIWGNVTRPYTPEYTQYLMAAPKTVIAVESKIMENVMSNGAQETLYVFPGSYTASQFVNDSMSYETIRYLRRGGTSEKTIYSISGKPLTFKKDGFTGEETINNIKIKERQLLYDGTNLIIIEDFLFNHYEQLTKTVSQVCYATPSSVVIPSVPTSMPSQMASSFTNLWQFWSTSTSQRQSSVIYAKTVLIVEDDSMYSVVPPTVKNPLYSCNNYELANRFINDSISTETISANDHRLGDSQGIIATTMAGNILQFKKDFNGKLTVNGIVIKEHKQLSDGTVVYVIQDFLFGYYSEIINSIEQGYAQIISKRDPPAVPDVSQYLKSNSYQFGAGSMVDIWSNITESYVYTFPQQLLPAPQTVIAVNDEKMNKTLSCGSRQILYVYPESYMSSRYLNDSMSYESVNQLDERMYEQNGLTIHAVSGMPITFRINRTTGEQTVNYIKVNYTQSLPDGTNLFVISDFFYEHQKDLQRAVSNVCQPVPSVYTLEIPDTMPQQAPSPFMNVWQHYKNIFPSQNQQTPKVVMVVESYKMHEVLPPHLLNPLYSNEYSNMTSHFMNDSMSYDSLNINDNNLNNPQGIYIYTLTGQQVHVKKDAVGKMSVNGISVTEYKVLYDQTVVLVMEDFLFNYYHELNNATVYLNHGRGNVIPQIPRQLQINTYQYNATVMTNIWNQLYRNYSSTCRSCITYSPKAVIVVEPSKMAVVFPNASNITYSDHETMAKFVLDCTTTDYINEYDNRTETVNGMPVATLSGKTLFIKKEYGIMTVNERKVVGLQHLPDGTLIITIDDFMFNHRQQLQRAVSPFNQTNSIAIPSIPISLLLHPQISNEPMIKIWNGQSSSSPIRLPVPTTVLIYDQLTNILSPQAIQALYDGFNATTASQILRDMMSYEYFDPTTSLPRGGTKTIKSLSGKDLTFRSNAFGDITVNYVEVVRYKKIRTTPIIFTIKGYLFNHEQLLKELAGGPRRGGKYYVNIPEQVYSYLPPHNS